MEASNFLKFYFCGYKHVVCTENLKVDMNYFLEQELQETLRV